MPLPASLSSLDRIDLVVITNTSDFLVIPGVPSANPIKPDIDESTQVELTFIYVKADSTAPEGVVNTTAYDENLQVLNGEWDTATNSGNVDLASIQDADSGSVSVKFDNSAIGDYANFTSDISYEGSKLSNILFKIKLTNPGIYEFDLTLINTNGLDGTPLTINHNKFNFSTTLLDVWQTIIVPRTVLGIDGKDYDRIQITNKLTNATFFVDNIITQTGTAPVITQPIIEKTSELINDGEDGVNPFLTALTIPATPIPTLQQVTDAEGTIANTTASIHVTGNNRRFGVFSNNGGETGNAWLGIDNLGNSELVLGKDYSETLGILKVDTLTDVRTYQLPDVSGTIALISDIPSTPTLQQVVDVNSNLNNISNITIVDGNVNIVMSKEGFYKLNSVTGDVLGITEENVSVSNAITGGVTLFTKDAIISGPSLANTLTLNFPADPQDNIQTFQAKTGDIALTSDIPAPLTNVAYTNVDNNFSVGQTINGELTLDNTLTIGDDTVTSQINYNSPILGLAKRIIISPETHTAQLDLRPSSASTNMPAFVIQTSNDGANGTDSFVIGKGSYTLSNNTFHLAASINGILNADSNNIAFSVSNTSDGRFEALTIKNTGEINVTKFLTVQGDITGNNLSGTNTGDQDLSGLVPYTGATSNVDLGVNNILANALQLVNGTEINWNTKYHTINVPTGDGAVTKVGLDTMFDIHNATGVPLLKGQVVYPDGTSTGGISNVQLCLANNHETINTLIGIIPFDIPNGSDGHVMVQGVIDPIDTSGLSEGPVYLSSTVLGGLTNTKPEFPNYAVLVGVVDSSAVSGVITVDTSYDVENTITQAWDGSFRESIDCLVSSNGTTITASLERKGGGDLTMMFSDGFTILDCTPAQTIALTPGTDIAPQVNYVYISKATKALVVSTSGFPSDEHIKVADIVVQSASGTQTNGALVNRNWNDHIKSVGDNGHLLHITERLRQNHAEWNSGILGSSTVSAPTLSNVYVSTTGGTVYQLHKQSFPVFNTTTGDDIHIVNHSTTPYTTVSNLNGQTTDSLGVSLANHSFSFVLWGVQNKTGENCHLMINLPKGSYAKNTPEDAVADAFNYSVYDIPKNFKGKGFLIARFTYVVEPNGTSWSLFDTEDLRGKVPNSAAGSFGGGGAGGVTEFDALTDTPSTKIGQALKLLRVGSGETAIEYETIENILPSNIAKTDVSNLFTEKQNIYETTSDTVLQLRSNLRTYVGVGFRESSGVGSDMGFIGIKRTDAPTASDSELHFRHAKSGVVSTSMMIDTAGNVGIGTEIPEAFLHVNGVNAGDFGALFQNSSSGAYVNNQFKNDLGNAGYIGIGGSTLAEGFASRLYLDTFNSNGISVLTEVGDLRFYYGGAAAINETVRLTENGTLEIGNSVVGTSGASIGGLLVEGTINGSNLSGTNTGDQDISGIGTNATNLSNHISSHPAPTIRDARNQIAGTYSTDIHTNITALNAVTGTNTGDNAVNTLYSGLADTSEWASYTGTIAAEDLIVKMGDHQNLVNGTGITIDLDNETVVVVGNFSATNISGANSGDNAVNTLYSGLVTNATHTGEVTGSGVLTIASDVIDIDNLASELKATTSLGNVSGTVTLNQSLGIQFNMTLTAASTIALTNPVQGKMITAIITGDFTLAVPASVKGDISAFDGAKTNQLQFYCLDSTTPLYSVTLLNW